MLSQEERDARWIAKHQGNDVKLWGLGLGLRRAREQRGLIRRDVEEQLGVEKQKLYRIETDKQPVTKEEFQELLWLYQMDPEDISTLAEKGS